MTQFLEHLLGFIISQMIAKTLSLSLFYSPFLFFQKKECDIVKGTPRFLIHCLKHTSFITIKERNALQEILTLKIANEHAFTSQSSCFCLGAKN